MAVDLFPKDKVIGVFRGFREGGLEFHADLVLPYRNDFQSIPMHGQFVLVQLETPDEAVLGRISSLSAEGKLSSGVGEEFNIRAVKDNRPIPEDLREKYLRYRVNIRVLGLLRKKDEDQLTFVPSHRRLPHVGSPVAFPSDEVMKEIAGHNINGAEIGHFALGEYIYAGNSQKLEVLDWMRITAPEITVKFPIKNIVSRRTFIFARAGFGKSNLNKLLFSKLYEEQPVVEKRNDKTVPVGTIIFDPDGEYFWPDDKNRPGLCDVPHLQERLVVFTNKTPPGDFYGSFVAGGVKLDIRRLSPADVISIALPAEKQGQQNIQKLKSLNLQSWKELVDLIDQDGNSADLNIISRILRIDDNQSQSAEAIAARSNMTTIVRTLHDRKSQTMDSIIEALRNGKICIVDLSQMRGLHGLIFSALILRRIFNINQEEFTKSNPKTIPTVAVIEEAQSVLNGNHPASEPFVEWVKEGRKYDLGAIMITQQPGSIPVEILSQGDNWFVFHLLSAADLITLKKANAHFSDDILSSLLNEPIPGQGIFWSSAEGKSYPIPLRILSFESLYEVIDKDGSKGPVPTYADELKRKIKERMNQVRNTSKARASSNEPESQNVDNPINDEDNGDIMTEIEKKVIEYVKNDDVLRKQMQRSKGIPWSGIMARLYPLVPEDLDNRDDIVYGLVGKVLHAAFGEQNEGWHAVRREGKTWIKLGPKRDEDASE